MPKSKTGHQTVRGAERRERVLELRKMGLSYSDIAKQTGVGKTQVHRDLTRAMAELADRTCDKADQLRAIETERLHDLIKYSWAAVKHGDPRAVANVVRISESLRKMWGLDAPDQVRVQDGGLTPEAVQTIRLRILGIEPTE